MPPSQPNQSLTDGLRCLQALANISEPVGARELARRLRFEPTRTHRLLRTLAHLGFARQNTEKKFLPGPGICVLASTALLHSRLARSAGRPIRELHRRVPHTVTLAMLWESTTTTIYRSSGRMPFESVWGRLHPEWATDSALGLVLLSRQPEEAVERAFWGRPIPHYTGGVRELLGHLRTIRNQGFATGPDHWVENHSMVAMALSDDTTGLAVSGGIEGDRISQILIYLRQTIEKIEGGDLFGNLGTANQLPLA